jgi:hypothetical protein
LADKETGSTKETGFTVDPDHPDVLDPTLVIPESLVVTVEERNDGAPLSALVERFGGYEFMVTDMFGQQRAVSLQPWMHSDHHTTRLVIRFRYQPSEKGRHA